MDRHGTTVRPSLYSRSAIGGNLVIRFMMEIAVALDFYVQSHDMYVAELIYATSEDIQITVLPWVCGDKVG